MSEMPVIGGCPAKLKVQSSAKNLGMAISALRASMYLWKFVSQAVASAWRSWEAIRLFLRVKFTYYGSAENEKLLCERIGSGNSATSYLKTDHATLSPFLYNEDWTMLSKIHRGTTRHAVYQTLMSQ